MTALSGRTHRPPRREPPRVGPTTPPRWHERSRLFQPARPGRRVVRRRRRAGCCARIAAPRSRGRRPPWPHAAAAAAGPPRARSGTTPRARSCCRRSRAPGGTALGAPCRVLGVAGSSRSPRRRAAARPTALSGAGAHRSRRSRASRPAPGPRATGGGGDRIRRVLRWDVGPAGEWRRGGRSGPLSRALTPPHPGRAKADAPGPRPRRASAPSVVGPRPRLARRAPRRQPAGRGWTSRGGGA